MVKSVPELSDNFSRLSKRMEGEFLPSLQQSLERISIVFDRDVNRIAQKVEKTTEALEGAALHALMVSEISVQSPENLMMAKVY